MKKVNLNDIEPEPWDSPKGTFAGRYQAVSIALGRDPGSTDLMQRHPFDVEIATVPPGRKNYPYHSHSAQWEYYQVMSGRQSPRRKLPLPGQPKVAGPLSGPDPDPVGGPRLLRRRGMREKMFWS
ncbi:MAG: hypothetical protein ACFE0O_00190 [Opitutales bacterium]